MSTTKKSYKNNWLRSELIHLVTVNCRNNRRCAPHRNRSSISYMKCILFSMMLIVMISVSSFIIVDASEKSEKDTIHKYYTSITIESEDTLWNIAKKYNTGTESTTQYVNSLKKLNNMSSDTIYNGNNLLVYYYEIEE